MTKKRTRAEIIRIIQYSITGGAWFWSGYAMFALCYSVLGIDLVWAKIISYIFGLSINFALERLWVFRGKDANKALNKVTYRYIFLSILNLGIDTVIVWQLDRMGISPYVGQFISAGFFTVWNYVWYRLWVFAKKTSPPHKRQASPILRRPKHVRIAHRKAIIHG